MDKTHQQLWAECQRIIADIIRPEQYDAWFKPVTSLGFENGRLTLSVPSPFFKEHIEDTYLNILGATLRRVYGEGIRLYYHYNQISNNPDTGINEAGLTSSPALRRKPSGLFQTPVEANFNSQLNPKYTFENYCGSSSNKIARAIGEAIANDPKCKTFNPLFVFGPTGVGKTHLIQAIGIKIKEKNPDARILYVSARLFESQYTVASHNGKINEFINFYQSIDTLIVDDIQDLIDKPRTQGTFFHIFNHLHQNGKQLILTSDRAPVLLQGMEERLITRFKWGMVAELEKPTVELRKNILRNKIHRDGLQFPQEVIDYIAENVGDSVRDLEGIVISIMAHSTIYNKEIDLELTQRIVRKVVNSESKAVTVDEIINTVCKHFGLETATIHTKSRKREVVQARQIAMYLAKNHTDFSTAKIGALIGHKDHATVLHACKTIKELKEVDKSFRAEIDEIQAALKKG